MSIYHSKLIWQFKFNLQLQFDFAFKFISPSQCNSAVWLQLDIPIELGNWNSVCNPYSINYLNSIRHSNVFWQFDFNFSFQFDFAIWIQFAIPNWFDDVNLIWHSILIPQLNLIHHSNLILQFEFDLHFKFNSAHWIKPETITQSNIFAHAFWRTRALRRH